MSLLVSTDPSIVSHLQDRFMLCKIKRHDERVERTACRPCELM